MYDALLAEQSFKQFPFPLIDFRTDYSNDDVKKCKKKSEVISTNVHPVIFLFTPHEAGLGYVGSKFTFTLSDSLILSL